MVAGAVAPATEPYTSAWRPCRPVLALLILRQVAVTASPPAGLQQDAVRSPPAVGKPLDANYTADEVHGGPTLRRVTAVHTRFALHAIQGSNIVAVAEDANNVNVQAGVTYPVFEIHANSGLGDSEALIRVKLVPYDMALTTCTDAVAVTKERPFNGLAAVANPNPDQELNTFPNVKFPHAGRFRLCYSAKGTRWEELFPAITVLGSEISTNKFWCPLSNLGRTECTSDTPITFCQCMGKVEGFKRHSVTNALMGLGLPDPPSPAWRATLVFMDKQCGNSQANPFDNKVSVVTDFEGYEVHNFGKKKPGTELGVWKICYCAGFDQDDDNGACFGRSPEDFPQLTGQLTTLDLKTMKGTREVTVYPTLRFSLVLQCGSNGRPSKPDSLRGGCTDTAEARYKIVPRAVENDKPYFEADSGCQYLAQAKTLVNGGKIMGGHIGPVNCVEPTRCLDDPETLGPETPTWKDVQMDATYENNVMIRAEYDVCYCDSNCENSAYWFKAGVITVRPVTAKITIPGVSDFQPVVNTRAYVEIKGTKGAKRGEGSWALPTDGTKTREMKLLKDCPGCVDKVTCLQERQPNAISGHRLVSGNTDYSEPEPILNTANRTIGQRYGKICDNQVPQNCVPNLKISDPGWYAICYCDSNCNEMLNWAVYGRALVAGPLQSQTWTRYTGVTFDLELEGWGLAITNRLLILSPSNMPADCGGYAQTENVDGPVDPAELLTQGTLASNIDEMEWDSRGTLITFSKRHGLADGDRILLVGVEITGTTDSDMASMQKDMYNTVHEVFRKCDDEATGCHQILIPVSFPAAEFPTIGKDSVTWKRNSRETFRKMKVSFNHPSPEGRGYVVCWSPLGTATTEFVGQPGSITVKKPLEMAEAALGLTTVMPNVPQGGAPVVVCFTTGDLAHYEQATGQMQLVISTMPGKPQGATSYVNVIEPRDNSLADLVTTEQTNDLIDANQAFCGKVFLEMWSEDPDGFPQPAGCWFDEDHTDPTMVVGGRGLKQLHILFSPRNHLKKQTRYMLVLNMDIKPELNANFPDTGAVWVWSMDDVHSNPFNVIELGRAYPSPASRVPPRDTQGNLQLSTGDDLQFDPANGFKIRPVSGAVTNGVVELTGHCRAYSTKNPDSSPTREKECKPCKTEEDCGNGGPGVPPNPALTFCVSPVEQACPGDHWDFLFDLKARTGHPIQRSSIVRLFLHPLTQWNIDSACRVIMEACKEPDGGGSCSEPYCASETVVGGPVIGITPYPINIMRIKLPDIMGHVADAVVNTLKVGSLPLPAGGFFPDTVTAELMNKREFSPDYWPRNSLAPGGARLYKEPVIRSAALVTRLGDGNAKPFRGDTGNKLYVRLVFGTNLWARSGEKLVLRFMLPLGYACSMKDTDGNAPALGVLDGMFPTTQGRLGGHQATETYWVPNANERCEVQFRENMIVYAGSTVFAELTIDNPTYAMKANDPLNFWDLSLVNSDWSPAIELPLYRIGPTELKPCSGFRSKFLCGSTLDPSDYSGNVSVLGKLTEAIIAPSAFGAAQRNTLSLFFRTEQEVGTLEQLETQIWVDAPPTFDFEQYCVATQLPSNYYIPEGRGTERIPAGDLIVCTGAPSSPEQLTYNRAKIRTTGRLRANTLYGFRVEVLNSPRYIRSQLDAWRIWTYTGGGHGVDGTFETPRFNEKDAVGPDTSWGIYRRSMPAGNFRVSFAGLLPTVDGVPPTEITILPIIVSLPMYRSVRILAPAGYIWYFEQYEFRYKAPAPGVLPSLVVQDAEEDLPISGVPARPISEPRNMLTVDYMQTSWKPGVRYGFAAKIMVPMVAPTGSANQFSIEFGYSEELNENRLEAGVFEPPLVQKLINGAVSSTTPIAGRDSMITLSLRTITDIPTAGGIMIIGPPNFQFAPLCQPKPSQGFPELPYDSTCLYEPVVATGQAEVSIVAGPSGIPARHYKFSLEARNPPQPMLEGTYSWVVLTYSLMSERTVLDYNTTIPSLAVGRLMLGAQLVMWPYRKCEFLSKEMQEQDPSLPITYCDFERWQFFPPRGFRDDRPGRSSQLIIQMRLSYDVLYTGDLVVRAPAGYEFNTECPIITYPSQRIFDDTATEQTPLQRVPDNVPLDPEIPNVVENVWRMYEHRYSPWPKNAGMLRCLGRGNVAKITLREGLRQGNRYLFRLGVLRNPMKTPTPNHFVLEYNGEASEPFEGVKIWAFENGTIIPTTTAASLRSRPTENVVTIYLRPVNDLPQGGHMRIVAPSGFTVSTKCSIAVSVHETERENYEAQLAAPGANTANMLKWLEFAEGDIQCLGDETPSSKCRLYFNNNGKHLKAGVFYVLKLKVLNPQTTSSARDPWAFYSYRDLTVNNLIDSASIPGFPINSAMEKFAYLTPESNNALAKHRLDINMSFPLTVEIGDTIAVVAPVSYIFNEQGDSRCPRYIYLDGSMRRTQPRCGANIISWHLQEESIPAKSSVRFLVQVQNPPTTPGSNLFQVRQVGADGTRKSSRMIPGYEIIPRLVNASVAKVPPSSQCRPVASIITGKVCEGAGSTGSVELRFTPTRSAELVQIRGHVAGQAFGLISAAFGSGVPTVARSDGAIVARIDLRPGVHFTLRVDGVTNPQASGLAHWSITTFTTAPIPGATTTTTVMPPRRCDLSGPCGAFPSSDFRRDETLDLETFEVLGYIDLLWQQVDPIYFNIKGATITFQTRMTYLTGVGDVFRVTRPPGYRLLANTLQTYRDLAVGENGPDLMRRFSTDYENPEDFYMVIEAPIKASDTMLFSIKADLPAIPDKTLNWFFRAYRVLPLLDTDGEILEDSRVPYPWIGRDLGPTGTNDGAFAGFLLVGQIPFTLDPMLQTPGAQIRLSFNFGLTEGVEAEGFLRLEITGPWDFKVKDSCFYRGSPEFSKCTGYKNTATLVTVRSKLKGSDITVHLSVTNPGATPSPNYWSMALFKDDDNQYVRWSQALSYEITSMDVVYKGNNQLGESASGFFTFTPVRSSPTPLVYIVVTPPPSAGFRLFCTGVSPLGFVQMPQCTSGGVNEPLELKFDNASLVAGKAFTFGIRVYNPGGKPLQSQNYWGVTLKDQTRQTFDGNLRILGLELKSVPVRCNGLGWTTAVPRVLGTVLVQMRFLYSLAGGSVTRLVIVAPDGVMFDENQDTVKILPRPLPLNKARMSTVAGDRLYLSLDQNEDIAAGLYNIRFDVSNPSVYPFDNTWNILVVKDIEVLFSHVFTGYVQGETSPFDLATTAGLTNAGHRTQDCTWPLVLGALVVALATS